METSGGRARGDKREAGGGGREERITPPPRAPRGSNPLKPDFFSSLSTTFPLPCAAPDLKNVEAAFPRQGACLTSACACMCGCMYSSGVIIKRCGVCVCACVCVCV